MLRSFLLACATATVAAAAAPATFYVSSALGSDANSGLSPSAPWQTLERAAAAAPLLTAGSSLLLRAGDEWVLSTAWFLDGLAGTAAAPITISSFASASSVDRPRIVRNTSTPAAGPTITCNGCAGIVFAGLEVVGGENGIAFTNDVGAGGGRTVYDAFTVTDCAFFSIRGLHYNASSGSWWGSAIAVAAAHAGVTLTHVSITRNLCNDSDVFYINSVPYAGWTRSEVVGLLVQGNTITHASYNTLFLDTTSFVSVDGNVFAHNTPSQLFVAGTTDIIMGTLNSSVTLTGNEISWRGEYQPGGPDGCAVDFETFADGVAFENNFVYRSYGSGVMFFGHGQSSINLQLRNNIMLYNGCLQQRDDHGGLAFMFLNSTGVIANNTFATCPGTPLFYARVPGASDGWTFADNVIDGEGGVAVAALSAPDVAASADGSGNIVLRAQCADAGAELRYSQDGSRPKPDAPLWPAAGALVLPPRAVAVNAKCFPPPAGASRAALAAALGATVLVESPVGGGIFLAPA